MNKKYGFHIKITGQDSKGRMAMSCAVDFEKAARVMAYLLQVDHKSLALPKSFRKEKP